MKRLAIVLVLVIGGNLWLAGAAPAEELKPISAAEAERRVTESRDSLTDMLWIGLDVYWHEGRWDDCLRLLRDIIVIDPHFVEAYTSAAWMLWSSDRDQEAIAVYEKGVKANPDDPDLYFEYGFYYRNRGQLGKAIDLLRKAAEKGATRGQRHLLPNTLQEAGRTQEALDEWRAVLKRFPKDPVAPRKITELEAELASKQEQQDNKGEAR
jgi:tetratricopeptide (TPR) repeat protein